MIRVFTSDFSLLFQCVFSLNGEFNAQSIFVISGKARFTNVIVKGLIPTTAEV